MNFVKGERVMTPLGVGRVAYQRMAPPDYTNAEVVSVLLDDRINNTGYNGSLFPADKVTKE